MVKINEFLLIIQYNYISLSELVCFASKKFRRLQRKV